MLAQGVRVFMLAIIYGIIGLSGLVGGSDARAAIRSDTIIVPLDTASKRVMTINRILIIGNKITHDRIISRELSLKTGDTISVWRLPHVLGRDKNKIYNLRLFNTVSLRVLETSAESFDLLIEVTERWYIFPAPIFELSDRNFNEWYQNYNHDFNRVNYGLRLYRNNFRGRNERLAFTAQFGFTRKFDFSYQIPYIDRKQKQGLFFTFDYGEPKNVAFFTQDHKLLYLQGRETLKKTFGASVTYTYRKSFYETHSLQFAYRNTSVVDSIALLNPNYFKENGTHQSWKSISYSFNSDHRDVILYPLKGYQYAGFISQTGLLGDRVKQLEVNLTQARHWDLKKGYCLSNFTSVYLSTPKTQPYSLYTALGYRRQIIRGYEIYVIEGPAYFLNKTTFKKRLFKGSWQWDDFPLPQFQYIPLAIYIKTYFDFGYVENYPYYKEMGFNTRLSDRWLGGAGAGLDVVTFYDLVFRFEYTFTREGTQGFFFNIKKEF
jgi:outer membrane protein assembly factor BamA